MTTTPCPDCGFTDCPDCPGCTACEGGACPTCGAGVSDDCLAQLDTAAPTIPAAPPTDTALEALRRSLTGVHR